MKRNKEVVVSIRMPSSLLREIRLLTKKQHYLDVSETIRAIVRKRCTAMMDPYSNEMAKFRKEIKKDLIHKAKTKTQLIQDLKRITEELADE